MKRAIIIGLVLLAVVVSAKDTVIYEDFDRYTGLLEWRDYWRCDYSKWGIAGREDKFLRFYYKDARRFDSRAYYYKELELKVGNRYSIQLDYYGHTADVVLGSTIIGTLYSNETWAKFKAEGTIKKTEQGQFWIFIAGSNEVELCVDNIIVEKCAIGIEPNSIGKIKALYE